MEKCFNQREQFVPRHPAVTGSQGSSNWDMTDLWVSLSVLAAAVLLCEATRRAAAPLLRQVHRIYLLETVSTFQLCCCTHELKLLAQTGGLEPRASAALTFTVTVVHLVTFREATCNPSAALESVCRGSRSVRAALVLMAFQFGAAAAARVFAASAWSLGLSDMHLRHRRFGFRCFDPLGGTVVEAAAVELACAFTVQAAVMHAHKLQDTLRVPFIAAVITAVVYTGVLTGLHRCVDWWLMGTRTWNRKTFLKFDEVEPSEAN